MGNLGLKDPKNRPPKQQTAFGAIEAANLQTAKAWHVRDNFKAMFTRTDEQSAQEVMLAWMESSKRAGVKAVNRVVKTFERHQEGILNAITTRTSSGVNMRTRTDEFNR